MKKNTKAIIGISIALVVLVGVLLLLIFWPKEKTDPNAAIDKGTDLSVATNDEGLFEAQVNTNDKGEIENNSYGTLLSLIPAKIKQIDVENTSGTYTITSKTPTTTTTNEDGEEVTTTDATVYTLVGFEKMNLATGIPDAVANDAAKLDFTKVAVLNAKDPAEYGLDKPRSTVKVAYTDGTSAIIKVGNVAPAAAGVYISFGTSNTVYLVEEDSVDGFLYSFLDMFDKNINTAAETQDKAVFTSIKIAGSNFPKTIVLENNNDTANTAYYKLTSPKERFVSVSEGSLVTGGIRGLYATAVVCVNPSEKQLSQYGLATPYATVEAAYPDVTVKLLASKPDGDDNVYLMEKGGKVIYQISAAKVPWVTTSYDELVSEYVLCPASSALSGVKINDGSKTYDFVVNTTSKKVTDDDGNETTESTTVVTYDKKELTLSNFEKYCQDIVSITRKDITETTVGGTPALTITYSYSTGRSDDTVKFYKTGEQYLATVNGDAIGHVAAASVETAISNAAKVAQDKTIS